MFRACNRLRVLQCIRNARLLSQRCSSQVHLKGETRMKCPYCAEVIQDDAILCRFCSATKLNGKWSHASTTPAAGESPFGGTKFTIRTAGVLFLASAVFEVMSITAAVPLFGGLRGGAAAIAYHLAYVGLFAAMGVGLWSAKSWGLQAVLAGTIFYTLDRCLYLLDGGARTAEASGALDGLGSLLDSETLGFVAQTMTLTTVLSIVCWWAFVFYLWQRRSYFHRVEI